MAATVVHLSGEDGLLDAAARVRGAGGEGDLVVVAPEGAPALANPLFLRALRDERPGRALVLVTGDARARAMASGVHMPAYASLVAYEQKTVDPTERLERARARALVEIGRERGKVFRARRNAAAAAALGVLLLAIVAPSAELVVAADAVAVGPLDVEVRTQPTGSVPATRLASQVSARIEGTATGARVERVRATGVVRISNASLSAIQVPKGTVFWTGSNIQFRTTEARTLPPSSILPFVVSQVEAPIEAIEPGPSGNVGRGTIVNRVDQRTRVTNDQPTRGGEEKRVPVVLAADYVAASARLDAALDAEAKKTVQSWMEKPPVGLLVEERYALRTISRTASVEVVNTEVDRFPLVAVGEVVGYAVAPGEPRASAIRRLGEVTLPGYRVEPDTVQVDRTATEITDDGLVWRVRARGSQRPVLDETALRLALYGQDPGSAEKLLADRGLRLLEVRSFPSWWPRLPFLPLRIDIRSGAAAALPRP